MVTNTTFGSNGITPVHAGSLLPFQGRSFGRFSGITNVPRTRHSKEELTALRERLTEYLHYVGVELHESGTRLLGHCPLHNDHNPSFAVFGDRLDMCGCHPCAFMGDVFDLAIALEKASNFPEAVEHVKSVLAGGNAGKMPYRLEKILKSRKTRVWDQEAFWMKEHRKVGEAARAEFDKAPDSELRWHTDQLGITADVLRKAAVGDHGLGLFEGKLAYVYPDGMKVRYPAPDIRRFMWQYGGPTVPWRWSRVTEDTHTIYLTEGETDCLALLAIGLEDDPGVACVAAPGTSFKREWAPGFVGRKVVVCFDNDEPGQKAARTVCALLSPFAESVSLWNGGGR